jgi:photosystem II stability/assembly factor-like uncharacterized protein
MRIAFLLLLFALSAHAQFTLEDAHTSGSLRGIDAVSDQIAWASGSGGTVLLTTDGGANWKHCAVPPGGAKLDFRGVQGFDARTAVVMASGTGPLSAIYKTTDGCATWKMVFANPDKDGFFDVLRKVTAHQMYLMGDPVGGKFAMFFSPDQGEKWFIADDPGLDAPKGAGGFAASNSGMMALGPFLLFGTGSSADGPAQVYRTVQNCPKAPAGAEVSCAIAWVPAAVPLAKGGSGAGVFSLAGRTSANMAGKLTAIVVAVGGDYTKPAENAGTAAVSSDGGATWTAAVTPPHGYRSAVTYAPLAGRWIAVGPNGTDVSRDDGKHWTALKPGSGDAADADSGWNAISSPFVVGAKGKIGRITAAALAK